MDIPFHYRFHHAIHHVFSKTDQLFIGISPSDSGREAGLSSFRAPQSPSRAVESIHDALITHLPALAT